MSSLEGCMDERSRHEYTRQQKEEGVESSGREGESQGHRLCRLIHARLGEFEEARFCESLDEEGCPRGAQTSTR